jgi:flagellar basal-body rod modification protein FlgD
MDDSKIVSNSKIFYNFSNKTTVRNTNGEFDKNVFLQILNAQLKNQDPMNAKDNTEYVAQMAQFSALEQMQNLNVSMEKLLLSQRLTEGSMLVDKEVGFKIGDTYVKDLVKSVLVEGGQVYLQSENHKYSIDQVAGVGDLKSDEQNSETSQSDSQ